VAQAAPDSGDIDILTAGIAGDGVVTGCAVTGQGSPNMTLASAAGTVRIAEVDVTVASGHHQHRGHDEPASRPCGGEQFRHEVGRRVLCHLSVVSDVS
jgi:hypothetical protein